MTTIPNRTSDVLNLAADLIEERGWVQGVSGWQSERRPAPLCLEGGLIAAMGTTYKEIYLREFWACPAYRAVQSYLNLGPVDPRRQETALWRFNDHHSEQRVIEVLRATALIESAEAREQVPA